MSEKSEHISMALSRLIPGADFTIRAFPNSDAERADPNFSPVITWNGPGQMPGNAAVAAEIATIKAEEAAAMAAKQAKRAAVIQARNELAAVDLNALNLTQGELKLLLAKMFLAFGIK